MSALPQPQHMQALQLANDIRISRGELKDEVAKLGRLAGAERIADLLLNPPPEMEGARIFDALKWVHRIGPSQARGILRIADPHGRAPIPERRRVDELTQRQREALAYFLRGIDATGSPAGASVTAVICPVCLLLGCTRKHKACSPTKPVCDECGTRLREPSPDGLCGFCRIEMAAA